MRTRAAGGSRPARRCAVRSGKGSRARGRDIGDLDPSPDLVHLQVPKRRRAPSGSVSRRTPRPRAAARACRSACAPCDRAAPRSTPAGASASTSLVIWPCRYSAVSGPLTRSIPRVERSSSPHSSRSWRYWASSSDSRWRPSCDSRKLALAALTSALLDLLKSVLDVSKSSQSHRGLREGDLLLAREDEGPVTNGGVAERLEVTPATATSMLQQARRARPRSSTSPIRAPA